MTIQEIIKVCQNTEKKFRRFCCFEFMSLKIKDGFIVWNDNNEKAVLPAKDY